LNVNVTVVYATDAAQDCVSLALPAGATVADAIRRSGLAAAWGLDLATLIVAIRGRAVSSTARLAEGDRVELLRPISADPKEARRRRAAARSRSTSSSSGPSGHRR
jgi:hypothetical protein